MHLLFIILNEEKFLEDALSVLVELGVTGANVTEVRSMGPMLAYDVPIFAGLRYQMEGRRPYAKLIFALVQDEGIVEQIAVSLKEVGLNFEQPGMGFIFTVPVGKVIGREQDLEL
jgi:nitrogen regulatory protein PII